ncbi:xanthine dehydrogenase/oxidase [Cinnamomum micranthum f. kanehirae]|uniref:Xanthine dehydrogenase/oxidase n=1 Tax=Cinnamomum micranthum f. kanehirae TaxID=337451 RepID=A0A3S3MQ67_9MAGN|nr:xanthine dehydrogenase/oxidase [Cinnamomum micranthum f. kanehirae]
MIVQIPRPISSGTESYGLGDPSEYPVSLPLPKLSSPSQGLESLKWPTNFLSTLQATGEAEYLDDLKFSSLHAACVLSSVSNAVIEEIDPSKALEVKGVMSFLSADTISASGYCNFIRIKQQPSTGMLCNWGSGEFKFHCCEAGRFRKGDKWQQGIHHTEMDIAIAAAEMVIVKYKDLTEPILTIEDAIRENSFFDTRGINFMKGNVGRSLGVADVIVEGEVHVGHQYHFHLETHRALCIPGEEGCMVVYSSTQNPSLVQQCVSVALNCPQHKITVNVKRVGGAYGAKLNRTPPVAMACAMAADMLQKPVRLVLDLPTNMQLVGGRSPYLCRYKAGAENNGRITAIEMHIFNNQGSHFDFEYPNLGNLPMFIEGVYSIENWKLKEKL